MGLAGNRRPYLVDASDIERWAGRLMARSDLARLVRSLITQTNDQVVLLEMRAGEGSEVAGYDGTVHTTRGSPLVPEGRSVWELGTGGDPAEKATTDYRNRTDDPLGEVQSDVTFVFVTPRRWPQKDAWIARMKADGCPWKDIRVIDVDGIEAGLEQAVGLHFIFSAQLGKAAYGVMGVEDWWRRFSTGSNPFLTADMVMAGRRDEASILLRLLEQDVRTTTITAASTDDVLAFVAATILSAPEERRLDLLGRCLIVRDARALQLLDVGAKMLILLPYEEGLHRDARLVRTHHVILLAPRDHPSDITLTPVDQREFARLLQLEGVAEDPARRLARAAARSLVAYQNQAAGSSRLRPQWTAWFGSRTVRRAWLAGGWTEIRSGDTEAMSELLGRPFRDAQDEIRGAAGGDDPLFTVIGQVWGVASPEATWDFIRPLLTGDDLAALEQSVQTVLGAIDPALEVPITDRWMAAVYGKSRIHSTNLRTGLATTLALLGTLGDSVNLGGGATARTWADGTVQQLLRRANEDQTGDLWTSFADVLPLLAEAAPDRFLGEVKTGATGDNPVLATLFAEDEATFAASSPHPGLLWALEVLAWSPEHLALAVDALARLAEIDPGGKLSNRPANSLVDVFRPWMPQTSASPDARLAVLESVSERHPDVGWTLLLNLLPDNQGFAVGTHAPRFRPWARPVAEVSAQEYWGAVDGVVTQLLSLTDRSPELWPSLLEHLPDIPPARRSEIYERLQRLAADA